jgi:Aminoarabinose transferase C-terminal domain
VLADQIRGYDGCVLASYRHFEQSLPFYTGRREVLVEYWGELAPFAQTPDERAGFIGTEARLQQLWTSDRCVVMVANRKDLKDLLKILKPAPRIIGCEGKKVALYNRADGQTPSGCDSAADTNSRAAPLWSSQQAALGFKADGR